VQDRAISKPYGVIKTPEILGRSWIILCAIALATGIMYAFLICSKVILEICLVFIVNWQDSWCAPTKILSLSGSNLSFIPWSFAAVVAVISEAIHSKENGPLYGITVSGKIQGCEAEKAIAPPPIPMIFRNARLSIVGVF
jgi:hypothetical protein